MVRASIFVVASVLSASAAFANPEVMSDEQLDRVVGGELGGELMGTLVLPDDTFLAFGATVDVADGLIGEMIVDTSDAGDDGGALLVGGIINTPNAP